MKKPHKVFPRNCFIWQCYNPESFFFNWWWKLLFFIALLQYAAVNVFFKWVYFSHYLIPKTTLSLLVAGTAVNFYYKRHWHLGWVFCKWHLRRQSPLVWIMSQSFNQNVFIRNTVSTFSFYYDSEPPLASCANVPNMWPITLKEPDSD